VAEGSFREDLYFRLSGARFQLPPLRERSDRLVLLNRLFEEEAQLCGGRAGLSTSALECLLSYAWPGNVRQLRYVLRYACAVSAGMTVQLSDLPEDVRGAPGPERSLAHSVEERVSPQRQLLLDALIRHRWKPGDAARSLGISRATLYRRVNLHGIEMPGKRRI